MAGDLESLREWITSGENGSLVDPEDPQALGAAIIESLKNPGLRQEAAQRNLQLVKERAEYGSVMDRALQFYKSIT